MVQWSAICIFDTEPGTPRTGQGAIHPSGYRGISMRFRADPRQR